MSEVIVITSGKGGVGKTTTSANVGTGLAILGKRVVLIDTDIGLRNLDVSVGDKEWRLASLQATDEVLYRYEHGNLIPYVPISMPVDCLKRVYLEDFRRQPLLFGTLNGFLKSKGLPAEQLLNLS